MAQPAASPARMRVAARIVFVAEGLCSLKRPNVPRCGSARAPSFVFRRPGFLPTLGAALGSFRKRRRTRATPTQMELLATLVQPVRTRRQGCGPVGLQDPPVVPDDAAIGPPRGRRPETNLLPGLDLSP